MHLIIKHSVVRLVKVIGKSCMAINLLPNMLVTLTFKAHRSISLSLSLFICVHVCVKHWNRSQLTRFRLYTVISGSSTPKVNFTERGVSFVLMSDDVLDVWLMRNALCLQNICLSTLIITEPTFSASSFLFFYFLCFCIFFVLCFCEHLFYIYVFACKINLSAFVVLCL